MTMQASDFGHAKTEGTMTNKLGAISDLLAGGDGTGVVGGTPGAKEELIRKHRQHAIYGSKLAHIDTLRRAMYLKIISQPLQTLKSLRSS